MIARRTPDADEPNGRADDGWCGMPHPFAPTPEQALAELYADREAAEQDIAAWERYAGQLEMRLGVSLCVNVALIAVLVSKLLGAW